MVQLVAGGFGALQAGGVYQAMAMLVAPTSDHDVVARTIETLEPSPRTATGEG